MNSHQHSQVATLAAHHSSPAFRLDMIHIFSLDYRTLGFESQNWLASPFEISHNMYRWKGCCFHSLLNSSAQTWALTLLNLCLMCVTWSRSILHFWRLFECKLLFGVLLQNLGYLLVWNSCCDSVMNYWILHLWLTLHKQGKRKPLPLLDVQESSLLKEMAQFLRPKSLFIRLKHLIHPLLGQQIKHKWLSTTMILFLRMMHKKRGMKGCF